VGAARPSVSIGVKRRMGRSTTDSRTNPVVNFSPKSRLRSREPAPYSDPMKTIVPAIAVASITFGFTSLFIPVVLVPMGRPQHNLAYEFLWRRGSSHPGGAVA
jgi:hypothetical protein